MSLGFVTWTIKIIFMQYNYMDLHRIEFNEMNKCAAKWIWSVARAPYDVCKWNECYNYHRTIRSRLCVNVCVCWKSIMQHKVFQNVGLHQLFCYFFSNNIRIVYDHIKETKFFKANIIIIKCILSKSDTDREREGESVCVCVKNRQIMWSISFHFHTPAN